MGLILTPCRMAAVAVPRKPDFAGSFSIAIRHRLICSLMPSKTIFICQIVAAAFLAMFWWQARQRTLALRQLASKCGFAFLGSTFPGSLDLTGTGLDAISSCWNVMDNQKQKPLRHRLLGPDPHVERLADAGRSHTQSIGQTSEDRKSVV